MLKVIVKPHPETGAFLTENSKNKEYSTVRLEQEVFTVSGRIVNRSNRVAFMTGKTEDLQSMGLTANGEFPIKGKITVKESTTPFYDGQEPKQTPDTGIVCKLEGAAIYRQSEFTTDLDAADVLVAHDNGEEIKAAQQNEVAKVKQRIGE